MLNARACLASRPMGFWRWRSREQPARLPWPAEHYFTVWRPTAS